MSDYSKTFSIKSLRRLIGEPPNELARQVVEKIKARDGKEAFQIFLPKLNEVTFGFKQYGINTIAARTSHGKSAFMVQAAMHLGKMGKNVSFVTLEDKNESVIERFICNLYKISNRDLLQGKLDIPVEQIEKDLEAYNIYYFDRYGFNIGELDEIHEFATFDEQGSKTDIFFIDYIGRTDHFLDHEKIANFMRHLDFWCKSKKVTVVLGAQVNRLGVGEVANDKIKGSGSIEEVSELVLMLNYPYQLGKNPKFREDYLHELQVLTSEAQRKGQKVDYEKLFNRTHYEISVTKGKSTSVGHSLHFSYFGEYYDFRERVCPEAMVHGFCPKHGYEPEEEPCNF